MRAAAAASSFPCSYREMSSSSLLSFRCSPSPSPSPSVISFSSSKTLTLTLNRSWSSNTKSCFQGIRIQTPPSSLGRNPSSSVKMMAKREEEMKEIRTKTTEEINEEIVDLKGELFMLRLQKSQRSDFKSSEFRRMRKRVARMLTVRRERELEEGINKRLSRKLDREWKKNVVVRPPPSLRKMQEQKAAEAEKAS
ncbi:50S ribosomal protein L29, chloroplastic [Cinnamomum micranthum f. kanehirae]|uniref:Large ribosomal subunit protein uL29c n=1 Tax=Cinnamomum micranthum f. kanehirae TaxID=337451 RepID=A0A443NL99_9MAGN|nr:50S ribosomal protein L29, chloroplastic [Cinnamomum micranthum f. kanehirae]